MQTPPLPDLPPAHRIATLDTVRGVAVMGIVFLNIVSFAMPEAAYLSPRAYGLDGPADRWTYYAVFVAFDGKMRGLFSFLFGASLLLIADRAGDDAALVHYRRMAWLLVLGLAHAVLLWSGDILVQYALIGSVAFLFRHHEPWRLIAFGVALSVVDLLLMGSIPLSFLAMTTAHTAQAAAGLREFEEGFGVPDPATIAAQLALFRGGFGGIVAHNLNQLAINLSNTVLIGFETLAYMVFGMAALRSGMLTGQWSQRRYLGWAITGIGLGGGGYTLIAAWMASRDLDTLAIVAGPLVLAIMPRAIMIAGWAAVLVLPGRAQGPLARRLADVGRMALSNYLATSIVMCFLFYGWGLGLFGRFSRAGLYPFVAAMCIAMLLWSPWWLSRFRYGPFEWLWRSLSRWQVQPIRISAQ